MQELADIAKPRYQQAFVAQAEKNFAEYNALVEKNYSNMAKSYKSALDVIHDGQLPGSLIRDVKTGRIKKIERTNGDLFGDDAEYFDLAKETKKKRTLKTAGADMMSSVFTSAEAGQVDPKYGYLFPEINAATGEIISGHPKTKGKLAIGRLKGIKPGAIMDDMKAKNPLPAATYDFTPPQIELDALGSIFTPFQTPKATRLVPAGRGFAPQITGPSTGTSMNEFLGKVAAEHYAGLTPRQKKTQRQKAAQARKKLGTGTPTPAHAGQVVQGVARSINFDDVKKDPSVVDRAFPTP
jgi:hypothetical protein